MKNRINHALVGLFVLVLGAAWLGISLWLTLGDYTTQYKTYRVFLDESVSGLYLDAPVKYRGVEVGKVVGIELNPEKPDQVMLTLDVVDTTPIRTDTVAELSAQGLTGIAFVDLKGGTVEAPPLQAQDGEEFPVIPSLPSFFARLDMSSTELITNLNALVSSLARMMDADGRAQLRNILNNLNTVTSTLARREAELDESLASAARLFRNSADASEKLAPLLAQVNDTASSIQVMAEQVATAGESLNSYVSSSGTGVTQFSQQTLPEFGALVAEMRRLANTMQKFGERLEEDPRALIYGNDLYPPGPGE